jgi:hypothetical protein
LPRNTIGIPVFGYGLMLYMLKPVRLTLVCTCCLEDVEKGMDLDIFQIFSVIKVDEFILLEVGNIRKFIYKFMRT